MKNSIIYFFAAVFLFSCKNEHQNLIKIEGKQLSITEELPSSKKIEEFIKPYKVHVEKEMNQILSYTRKDLVRTDGELESSLGNLMADMCYERANSVFRSRIGKDIDFALFNYGGIRAGIPKGEITYENAFKLMPFENSLVVVELSHQKLNELIQYLIDQNRAHPVSNHLRLTLTTNNYELEINKKPIDKNRTYFVLTSDYLQNGGDNMTFFKNPINLFKLNYKVRNAIIDYFNETDTISVELDGRFKTER